MKIIKAQFRPLLIGLLVALALASTGAWATWAYATHAWPFCGGSNGDGGPTPMSVQNLTQTSDVIVMGRVDRIGPSWRASSGPIVTNITVVTTEYVRPEGATGQLEIVAAGGTIGCWTETVSYEPKFAPNEQVLLFLVTGPQGYLRVTGAIQGKYTISGEYAYNIDPSYGMILLNDLISEIRQYL